MLWERARALPNGTETQRKFPCGPHNGSAGMHALGPNIVTTINVSACADASDLRRHTSARAEVFPLEVRDSKQGPAREHAFDVSTRDLFDSAHVVRAITTY